MKRRIVYYLIQACLLQSIIFAGETASEWLGKSSALSYLITLNFMMSFNVVHGYDSPSVWIPRFWFGEDKDESRLSRTLVMVIKIWFWIWIPLGIRDESKKASISIVLVVFLCSWSMEILIWRRRWRIRKQRCWWLKSNANPEHNDVDTETQCEDAPPCCWSQNRSGVDVKTRFESIEECDLVLFVEVISAMNVFSWAFLSPYLFQLI